MIRKLIIAVAKALSGLRCRVASVVALACVSVLSLILLFSSLSFVTVKDANDTYNLISTKSDVSSILSDLGVEYLSDDIINTEANGNKLNISLDRAFTVKITVGDKTTSVLTQDCTVADVLNTAGIKLTEHDLVSPSVETKLSSESVIDIVDIDYVTESTETSIPYETKTVKSSKLLSGTKKVSGGTNGVKVLTYKKKIVNGVVAESECIGEDVVKEPVDQVITIGTGVVSTSGTTNSSKWISQLKPKNDILLDKNGVPVNYKKKITGTATAYHGDGKTSTGVKPKPGYIAVNPKVIPYGTKMYIRSSDGEYIYGYAVAADTGGACMRNRIVADLYFPDRYSMNRFGRRQIEIYILD